MVIGGRGSPLSLPISGSHVQMPRMQDWYPITWWARQGVAFAATQGAEQANVEEPHVFYEGNPQILTTYTNVFKMWYGVGGFGNPVDFCYAESADGLAWTKYASNPLIQDFRRTCVVKEAGTYYIFGADVNATYDHYDLYTSSDGITMALDTSNIMAVGAAGQWDENQLGNSFVWVEGSTWYMLYDANRASNIWSEGLATASNPQGPWTKSSSNPVIASIGMRGGVHCYKASDGYYYLWGQYHPTTNAPTDIAMWRSIDLVQWLVVAMPYWYRDTADEGVGVAGGQVADTSIVAVNAKSYFYLGGHASQAANGVMKVQTMTGREDDLVKVRCPTLTNAVLIDSAQPTVNLLANSSLWIGEASDVASTRRLLLNFHLADVLPSRVWAARLRLYCDADFSTNARDFKVYRLLQPYVANEVTWNNRTTATAWQTAGASGAADTDSTVLATRNFSATETLNAWKEWELDRSVIEGMLNGTYNNYGFLIKADTENSDAYRFTPSFSDFKPQLLLLLETVGELPVDTDAQILIDAMASEPDSTRKELIGWTVQRLKEEGIWAKLDELWFFAAHTEQAALLGWKRYKNCTSVGSMPFTTDRGFQRDSGTKYLSTGYNPLTHGVTYTQNDCCFGVYSRTDMQDGAGVDIGCINVRLCQIQSRNASGNGIGQVNITAGSLQVAVATSLGWYTACRTTSTAQQLYKNGVQITSNTSTSGARPSATFIIGGRDNVGVIEAFSTRQYSAAVVGGSLTAAEQLTLYNIVQSYLTAVGAQV